MPRFEGRRITARTMSTAVHVWAPGDKLTLISGWCRHKGGGPCGSAQQPLGELSRVVHSEDPVLFDSVMGI